MQDRMKVRQFPGLGETLVANFEATWEEPQPDWGGDPTAAVRGAVADEIYAPAGGQVAPARQKRPVVG
jgi:hypothetical protein